jgi:hypothetical protein
MLRRPIEEWWHDLDPEIHDWFAENPGCLVLPRTIANTLCKVADCHDDQDRHGRLELPVRDRKFIRTQVQVMSLPRSNSRRRINKQETF